MYSSRTERTDGKMEEERRQTPFACHKGDFARYDMPKPAGKVTSIRGIFERRLLKDGEIAVMEALRDYTYLNAHMACRILGQQMECKPEYIKKVLAKLVGIGLLARFRFIYRDKDGKEHASVYIYSFSEKGRKLYSVGEKTARQPTSKEVFSMLAFNQFYIALKAAYHTALIHSVYCYGRAQFDGRFLFANAGKRFAVNVMAIRQNEGWEEGFVARLRWQERAEKCHMILVLCETELQALAAEQRRMSVEELKGYNINYLCDYASSSGDGPLSQVMRISPENAYTTYDICAISMDGDAGGIRKENNEE